MNISAYEFLSILQAREAGQVEEKQPESAGAEYLAILDYVRSTIAQKHANEMSAALDNEAAARTLKSLIMKYTTDYMSGVDFDREALVERIYQDMAGLGLLTKYLFDPNIEEININGYNTIEIIRPDRTDYLYGKDAFASPEAALDIVKRMVRMGGKLLDAQSPQVDSFIGSGTRINATIPPLIPSDYGVVSSIRKQIRQRITKDMIVNAGTATDDMLDFLVMCLCNHVSIGLAGATGSGKSALQSFLLNEYITTNEDYNNRVYLVEDTQELNLLNYDVANDRPARIIPMLTSEGPVKVTMGDLVKGALRYHPNIIVPAEVRDECVFEAMHAGESGHTILTSFHADSARDGYSRLLSLCHMSGTSIRDEMLLDECIRAWPIMVFQRQLKDNTRKMMEIYEATGQKYGQVKGNMLFRFVIESTIRDVHGRVTKVEGHHEQVGNISPHLYRRLLDNGASEDFLKRLFPTVVPEDS